MIKKSKKMDIKIQTFGFLCPVRLKYSVNKVFFKVAHILMNCFVYKRIKGGVYIDTKKNEC